MVPEDRLAPVAAICSRRSRSPLAKAFGVHDACRTGVSQRKRMVDRAGILDSQLAGQDGRVARAASCVNIKNRPLSEVSLLRSVGALFNSRFNPDLIESVWQSGGGWIVEVETAVEGKIREDRRPVHRVGRGKNHAAAGGRTHDVELE
jgi:hypothetical protein